MTKKTLKQREEDPTYWKDRDDLYIHYLYKITNKTNQRYYIGIHSILKSKGIDPINDGYYGSGTEIKKAVKEEGKSNFSKEILKIFSTRDELREAEKEIVTDDIVKDPMSYNKTLGGGKNNCSKVYVVEKSTGKSILIDNEEYYKNKDLYESVIKDSVMVRRVDDPDKKYFIISREEYYKNKNKYLTASSGKILVKKLDDFGNPVGDYIYVDKNEYYNNKESYVVSLPSSKGKVNCRNVNNPENRKSLRYDDPRYISGEYIPVTKGKCLTEEQKEKKRGSGNSMYGKTFINNGKINKSVKKEELEDFLKSNPDWKRGRTGRTSINKKAYRNIETKELKYFLSDKVDNNWKLGFLFNKNLEYISKETIENAIKTNDIKSKSKLSKVLNIGKQSLENSLKYYNININGKKNVANKNERDSIIKRALKKHICKECGKVFYTDRSNSSYCSKECVSKSQTKGIPDKEELILNFSKLRSLSKVGKLYNVSHSTVNNWIKQLNIREEITNIRLNREKRSYVPRKKDKFVGYCQICGKEIFSDRTDKVRKYCSKECADKANSMRAMKKDISKEELLIKLIEFNGNYTELGKDLNMYRGTIRDLVKKFGLEEEVNKIRKNSKNQSKKITSNKDI